MRIIFTLSFCLGILCPAFNQQPYAYLRSTAGQPWGNNSNEDAMNEVFGSGNWDDLRFETANIGTLLSGRTFIYMDGSEYGANAMEAFLDANLTALEAWVNAGGNLFLNAGPNTGDGMSYGFGGTQLNYNSAANNVVAVGPHPIFDGPYLPVGTSWSGNSFSHAWVNGSGLTPLVAQTGNSSVVALAFKSWGAGKVIFGGMTTYNFHSPATEAKNLRKNILEFLRFNPVAVDAGVLSVGNGTAFCAGTQPVTALIANLGTDTLNSVNVNWSFNGTPQTPLAYTTPLDTVGSGNNTASVTLGSQSFTLGVPYTLKVWTSDPNGMLDTVNFNDTILLAGSPGLGGTLTIGGASPDYATFAAAVAALEAHGVCGPVTFNVRNGTYNEQVSIGVIPGASAAAPVTFQSESGDSSLVTLSFAASESDNYTLRLNGTDWVTFHQMTISATGPDNSRVLEITEGADHNTFSHNVLQGVSTTLEYTNQAVVYSPYTHVNGHNAYLRNRIVDGSFGLYIEGNYNGGNYSPGLIVEGNTLENQYNQGLFIQQQSGVTVSGNLVQSNSTFPYYGIYLTQMGGGGNITGNRVTGLPHASYGIRLSFLNGNSLQPFLVANNYVQMGSGLDDASGLMMEYGEYVNVLHNTVHMAGSGYGNAAFYNYSGGDKTLLNNIFSHTGGGLALRSYYGLSVSNHNDLFSTGESVAQFADTDYATLTDWTAATTLDSQSLSLDPSFAAVGDFHVSAIELNGAAIPFPAIGTDIEGEARDAMTPDIGADEFTPANDDAALTAFAAPTQPFLPGSNPVEVVLKNNGGNTLTSASIDWAINGAPLGTLSWTGSLAPAERDTVALGNVSFNVGTEYDLLAWSSLPNGMTDPNPANDTTASENLFTALAGTYTIGGASPDFLSFTEAAAALHQRGVSASVTFMVRDGLYEEQISIEEVTGASAANTVTFQSESGDSSLAILSFASLSYDSNYTLRLDGADYLRFHQLSVRATHSFWGRALWVTGGASHNTWSNCLLQGVATSETWSELVVATVQHTNSQRNEHNVFEQNHFLDGSYGLIYDGYLSGIFVEGVEVRGNTFENQYVSSLFVNSLQAPIVDNNLIQNNLGYPGFTGAYFTGLQGNSHITRNRANLEQGGSTGLQFDNIYSLPGTTLVANNFVHLGGSTGSSNGMSFYYCENLDILFNTVHVSNSDAFSKPMQVYYGAQLNLKNNILANTGGGKAIETYFAGLAASDRNDLYTTGPVLGTWNSADQADLANWQTASSLDVLSISIDPLFAAPGSYVVNEVALNAAAQPSPSVTGDIEGNLRDASTPDIGAYEFTPPAFDATLTGFTAPLMPFTAGAQNVEVVLKNNGLNSLSGVTIHWQVNGGPQLPFAWTGSLASGASETVTIGALIFDAGEVYDLKVWTFEPNGMADNFPANDTTEVFNLLAGLSGIYTIGGVTPDFLNFGEAEIALNYGGVVGPVTFMVRNGTYNEQVSLNQIAGASAANTVTFQSEAGDSTLVVLAFSATDADHPYTLRLNGADYVSFREMSIEASNASPGEAVRIQGGSHHIEFANNRLLLAGGDEICVLVDENQLNEHLSFLNNVVSGGYYGLYAAGNYNGGQHSAGLLVQGNTFSGQVSMCLFVFQQNYPIIKGNEFSSPSRGIYLNEGSFGGEVLGNYLHGVTSLGIQSEYFGGQAGSPLLIANNFVHTTGTVGSHGIYLVYGSYLNVYHNSVHAVNSNPGSTAFYNYFGSQKRVVNNIFANTGGGYAFYNTGSSAIAQSDYNDLYVTGTWLGYWNGLRANLAAWQAASGWDAHSVSLDPEFASPTDLHVSAAGLNSAATPLSGGAGGVNTDFDGQTRDPTLPDIGADEFATASEDAAILSIDSPAVPFAAGTLPVLFTLFNNGGNPLTSLTLNWEVNGLPQTPLNWTGTLASNQSLAGVSLGSLPFLAGNSYDIKAWASLPNGLPDPNPTNDTTEVLDLVPALGGTYTIGGTTPDFPDFTSAAAALHAGGIIAPVTFNVRNGTYAERIALNAITGASAGQPVTFQSESGDSSLVVLSYHNVSESSQNYTLLLNGADHLRFKRMTFAATGGYNRTVELRNGADLNRFEHCRFEQAFVNYELVFSNYNSQNDNGNVFEDNHFYLGTYGLLLYGNNQETGTVVRGNKFENQLYGGVYLHSHVAPLVESNTVTTTYTNDFYGIYLQLCHNGAQVLKNTVGPIPRGNGIYIYNCDNAVGSEALIANNFVQVGSNNSTASGIVTDASDRVFIYHNNVRISGSYAYTYALAVYSGNFVTVRNNVLANFGSGYAIYRDSGSGFSSNYNDLHSTGSYLGEWVSTDATDLAAWQAASAQDANSLSIDPLFTSATDLHVNEVGLNAAATPLAQVTDDIDGEARHASTPDIGADEFTPPSLDASLTGLASPVVPFAAGSQNVQVFLKNTGNDPLTSATLNWTLNGSLQAPVSWTGSLNSGATATATLGSHTFAAGTVYDIEAWVSSPNGMTDPNVMNDSTAAYDLVAALSGIYTIGGMTPDFLNFTQAVAALHAGGVIGAVTFNVRNGNYVEQVSINPVLGVSASNTVTFQSESGDSSLVSLRFSVNNGNANYTLRLNGADHLTFSRLSIEGINASTGRTVLIEGGSNHLQFNHCYLRTAATNEYNVVISGDQPNEHIAFNNNDIRRGYYAIYAVGNYNNGNYAAGFWAAGNKCSEQVYVGLLLNQMRAPIVRDNEVWGTQTGIQVSGTAFGGEITGNYLHDLTSNGIYLDYFSGNSGGTRALVANNFIHVSGSGGGYGIYSYDNYYADYYHNSVNMASTQGNSAALYSIYGSNKRVVNNILAAMGGGYAFYNNSPSSIIQSDYNDLYTTGPILGIWNGDRANLAAWQAASSRDAHSVSLDPTFASATDLHTGLANLNAKATPLAAVPTDIDGQARHATTPDIGADEFDIASEDAGVLSINSPLKPFAEGIQPITVTLLNNGADTLEAVTIHWEVNGTPQAPLNWTGELLTGVSQGGINLGTFFFGIGAAHDIRAWTSLPNGLADPLNSNDTAQVLDLYAALNGTYTIGGAAPDFPDFTQAVLALDRGGVVGTVAFDVRNGSYVEQVEIPQITGASASQTITFRSESGDTALVNLNHNGSHVLRLNGADWLRFEDISIEATNNGYQYVTQIINGASDNRFEGCQIKGRLNGTLVHSDGGSDNDHRNAFIGNRFYKGQYGFLYNGNSFETGTVVQGNEFYDQSYMGISFYRQQAALVEGNRFVRLSGNFAYGIHANYCPGNLRILKNDLTGFPYGHGILLYDCDGTAGSEGLIANNFVQVGSSNSTAVGIYLQYSDRVRVYHNNVHIVSANVGSIAFRTEGGSIQDLKNNVFANSGGGYAYYNSGTSSLTTDHNDLYAAGSNLGYWNGTNAAQLAAWQAATGQESHSISADPGFASSTDLHVAESDLNEAGTPLAQVTQDYDGEPRDPATPDIGADEFAPTSFNDAGVVAILHPSDLLPFAAGSQNVVVVVKNNGADTLGSMTVQWRVNNSPQAPYAWSGTLPPGERDTVALGSFSFALGFSHDLLAYTENPDGAPDVTNFNDTTLVTGLYPGLSGAYTIGGALPDFSNFSSAVTSLNEGGVLGPVTFNVRNGTYPEQIQINAIKGGSAANTVLFQSEELDSALVKLTFGNGDPLVYLNSADYLSFRHLTLEKTGWGDVLRFDNEANHLSVTENHFLAPVGVSNLLISGSTTDDHAYIARNRMEGGDAGIRLLGQSASVLETGNVVEDNELSGANFGIMLGSQDAPLVQRNTISSGQYGIYAYSLRNAFRLLKNKINVSDYYGMYLHVCEGTGAARGLVANNFVHVAGSNAAQGLYIYGGTYTDCHYNSVHLSNTNANSRAFYNYYGSNKNLLNNVFANTGGGYAAYVDGGGSGIASSNFNGLYTTGAQLGRWNGTNAANLAAYQALSSKEASSISEDPLFFSASDLHTLQTSFDSAATVVALITEDIDGEPRDANYPDIGADEIAFLPDDLGVKQLLAPASACTLSSTQPLTVKVQNYSSSPLTGFSLAYSLNGAAPVTASAGALSVAAGGTANFTFPGTLNLGTPGTYGLAIWTVFAPDLNAANDTLHASVTHTGAPATVANMIPAEGAANQPLVITFSWSPAAAATKYDLYIWPAAGNQPATPTAANITQISHYFYGYGFFSYGASYKWRIVARNEFCSTPGPVQTFTILNLPDLTVGSVTAPASGFSGQSLTLAWLVDNIGSGSTGMGQWTDAVYLSADAVFQQNLDTYLGGAPNFSALASGDDYSNTASFTLPNGISGTYYLFVVTDRYGYIAEQNNDNNTGISAATSITLTPPPDLQVASIVTPANAFSGTPFTLNYTVRNMGTGDTRSSGWQDQIWLSPDAVLNTANAVNLGTKQFSGMLDVNEAYTHSHTANLPNGINGTYYIYVITDLYNHEYEHANESNNTGQSPSFNIILTPPPDLQVTAISAPASGSNKEQVSLSWTVENFGGTATASGWSERVYLSTNPSLTSFGSAISLGDFPRPNDLSPGDSYVRTANVTLPDGVTGDYYFYIYTDIGENIFEHTLNSNNHLRATAVTSILTPDLAMQNVATSGTPMSGATLGVSWTLQNAGTGKLVNGSWTDRVYISTSATYGGGATLLGSLAGSGTLLPGASLNRSLDVVLPNGISGAYHVFVVTDAAANIYENGSEANNVNAPGQAISVSLSPYPDLNPIALTGPGSATAGESVSVSYTVQNMGTGAASGNWKDKIYMLNSLTWNPAAAQLLRTEAISQVLALNGTYSRTATVVIPFAAASGTYYFFVETDQEAAIYEYTFENNNRMASAGLLVTAYPPVDLSTVAVTAPAAANSGDNIPVTWTVENLAAVPTIAPNWSDGVYLSTDAVFSPGTDLLIGSRQQNGPLPQGTTYSVMQSFTLPNGISGTYYLIVRADRTGQNNDNNFANNAKAATGGGGSPQPIVITLTPPADLVVTSFSAPPNAFSGQPLSLQWTVSNSGTGATTAGSWTDRLYLSTDFTLDGSDYPLGAVPRSGDLTPGQSYTATGEFDIPISFSGNYIVFLRTDANNGVYEHGAGEGNNTANSALLVTVPPPSDLVVQDVTLPLSALAGEQVTIAWTLRNQGSNPAAGYMKEAVFFSKDPVWDAADPLLDVLNTSINLAPSATLPRSMMADLTGVEVDDYYAIVRTDILNNIAESNDGNNTGVSAGTMSVTVPELPLNVLTPDVLEDDKELYYRIEIADSLAEESLLVTMKGDSISGANELYLRHAQVPTRAVYDYAYEAPFFGNQDIIVPSLFTGTYYLLAYGNTTAGSSQPITLLARRLNFEIRSVEASQGGNTGSVTVEIKGAKFQESTEFSLVDGAMAIPAATVFVDQTRVFATFDLRGQPTGLYDVRALRADGQEAALPDAFEVVTGQPPQLSVSIVQPGNAAPNRVNTFRVDFANDGNVDLALPQVVLNSVAGAPVSLDVPGLEESLVALTLTLLEEGGPAGVLRPGAAGSIVVYTKSVTGLGFVLELPEFD